MSASATPSASFTPGPWRVEPHPNYKLGYSVVVHIGQDLGPIPAEIAQFIESAANAHLIAAAPLMHDYIERRAAAGDREAQQILEVASGCP